MFEPLLAAVFLAFIVADACPPAYLPLTRSSSDYAHISLVVSSDVCMSPSYESCLLYISHMPLDLPENNLPEFLNV